MMSALVWFTTNSMCFFDNGLVSGFVRHFILGSHEGLGFLIKRATTLIFGNLVAIVEEWAKK